MPVTAWPDALRSSVDIDSEVVVIGEFPGAALAGPAGVLRRLAPVAALERDPRCPQRSLALNNRTCGGSTREFGTAWTGTGSL